MVIPAGLSGDLSHFCHTCVSVAGIHLKKTQIDSRLTMSGITRKIDINLHPGLLGALPPACFLFSLRLFKFFLPISETAS
jgi:hypothetical protein